MSSGASLQVVLGESHDCCKLTFRREGGREFELHLGPH
jgi:hypothetical protein